jgi:hypothetical protein
VVSELELDTLFLSTFWAPPPPPLTSDFLSRIMSTKFDIPKFGGKIIFAIWQIQMKIVFTRLVIQKTLRT